jgi:hypothetical protein
MDDPADEKLTTLNRRDPYRKLNLLMIAGSSFECSINMKPSSGVNKAE